MSLRALLLALLLGLLAGTAPAQPAKDEPAARQLLVLLPLPAEHFRPDSGYAGAYADGPGAAARRRLAARLAREHGLALGIDWPMPALGLHCFVMALPEGASAQGALDALGREPAVAWAQPMHVYEGRAAHDDPLYPAQPTAAAWRLAELHERATGRGVRVAVLDSGVALDHPDLAGQVALAQNFAGGAWVAEQHGTGVAALIAARADDGIGIAGVAPGARLLALRACRERADASTRCDSLGLALALQSAMTHDAQVINLSLAGPPDRLLDALLDAALARGTSIVAAADRGLPGGGFPASHRGVIAVVDEDGAPGPPGSLAAPGRDLPTAAPHGAWRLASGASYAAAQASGLVALLRELRGGARLDAASLVLGAGGAIDACATLARAAGAGGCALAQAASRAP